MRFNTDCASITRNRSTHLRQGREAFVEVKPLREFRILVLADSPTLRPRASIRAQRIDCRQQLTETYADTKDINPSHPPHCHPNFCRCKNYTDRPRQISVWFSR